MDSPRRALFWSPRGDVGASLPTDAGIALQAMAGPTRRQIADQDALMVERQRVFRLLADRMAIALAGVDFVEKVALIGSVAGALWREVPRFQPFRRLGIEIAHECKDLDLAVWVSRVDRLAALKRVRASVSRGLFADLDVGVPEHQIELFLIETGDPDRYLGRVCCYRSCPRGHRDCLAEGCGASPFLQQMDGFEFWPSTLEASKSLTLFDRSHGGVVGSAVALPATVVTDTRPDRGRRRSAAKSPAADSILPHPAGRRNRHD